MLICCLLWLNAEYWKGKRCVFVCLCGLEWQKGWLWRLHPKKGFLSRWQLQDWQDAILLGNGVSQPVSLPVRQPLTPLNLAFCWAVTGLALTLHVASLINYTMKSTRWELASMNSLCHNTQLEVPLMALMTKTALSPGSFTALALSLHKHSPTLLWTLLCWQYLLDGWTLKVTRPRLGHCAHMEMTISLCVCVCQRVKEKKKEVCSISSTRTL